MSRDSDLRPQHQRRASPRRGVVVATLLLVSSLLVALGVLEVALRMLYPPPARFLYPQESYDFDPEIGHMLRRGQAAFTHDHPVTTNALGLRDHDVMPTAAPDTVRVLALGDSQTFGNGLALGDTWPKQLERMLRAMSPNQWEVINAGVPGTDTWQHEILLRRLLDATTPHVVVLALYVNDVVPRHDPRIVDTATKTNTWSKRITYLLKRSAVVTWAYYRLYLPWQSRHSHHAGSVEAAVLADRDDPRAQRGWTQVEQSLMAMKALCDARRSTFIVALLPRRDQVSGTLSGRAFNERALSILTAHGIGAVDLLPELAAAYRMVAGDLFIPWDGHNSAAANQVVATALAARLVDVAPRRIGR